jgi:bifunctional DNase/RNase
MIALMNIATPIEVKVKSLIFYKEKEIAIILLEGLDGAWGLPILAKATEVTSIFLSLEGENPPRPLSHDLIANILHELKAHVLHVLIDILEDPICHGIIAVDLGGKELDFDARPSDAISLAMRTRVPIYVSPAVVNKGAIVFNRQEWAEDLGEKAKLQN